MHSNRLPCHSFFSIIQVYRQSNVKTIVKNVKKLPSLKIAVIVPLTAVAIPTKLRSVGSDWLECLYSLLAVAVLSPKICLRRPGARRPGPSSAVLFSLEVGLGPHLDRIGKARCFAAVGHRETC